MKTFRATFIYKEEAYDEVYEAESEDDVEYEIEWAFEAEAFYDNHYVSNLSIEEVSTNTTTEEISTNHNMMISTDYML